MNNAIIRYIVEAIKFYQFALAWNCMLCYRNDIQQIKRCVKTEISNEEWKLFKFFQKHVSSKELCYHPVFNIKPKNLNLIYNLFDQGKLEKAKALIGGRALWKLAEQAIAKENFSCLKFLLDYQLQCNIAYKFRNEENQSEAKVAAVKFCAGLLGYINMRLNEIDVVTEEPMTSDITFAKMVDYCLTKSEGQIQAMQLDGPVLKTSLHMCIQKNYFEIIKILLQHQADINYCNMSPGSERPLGTPLYIALECNNYELAKILVQHGAVEYLSGRVDSMDKKAGHPQVEALLHAVEFLKNTGFFTENKCLSEKKLNDLLKISDFIQTKCKTLSNFYELIGSVDSKTLLSQLAYEFRLDSRLLCFYIEAVQLEASKLQLLDYYVETSDQHRTEDAGCFCAVMFNSNNDVKLQGDCEDIAN
ncbi:ankyrin repeat family protein [Orientia chuto str. Dubai]|uniref:Ankyrin repeat family protein n=1 Tax=Orientia chuto str. Dubai TaxID=1359168 RepID=A0A0F3MLX7_9RICK|nr:ankyrin repeat domain-containing protein [Candidatus Orientia mediorientalis]KJV56656.1 ankyrin repeat family protein [Orientia chuto str. Dubai]